MAKASKETANPHALLQEVYAELSNVEDARTVADRQATADKLKKYLEDNGISLS